MQGMEKIGRLVVGLILAAIIWQIGVYLFDQLGRFNATSSPASQPFNDH